jgi:hypothetical protein
MCLGGYGRLQQMDGLLDAGPVIISEDRTLHLKCISTDVVSALL